MRRIAQRFANACGYQVTKFRPDNSPHEAMRSLLGQQGCRMIFDVGAHHGVTVRSFRQSFPSAQIFAFEPFAESFAVLSAATKSDPKVTVLEIGLSDTTGSRRFHLNRSSMTNSLLSADEAGTQAWGKRLLEPMGAVEAQFSTLDAVMAEQRISEIDILKLDVQGGEPLVMIGAADACRRGAIRLVYTEIMVHLSYAGQRRFDEGLRVFYDRGFELYGLYGLDYTESGPLGCVDALFVRK